MQAAFFTTEKFYTTCWEKAFPGALVYTTEYPIIQNADTIVFIYIKVEHWQSKVSKLSQSNNVIVLSGQLTLSELQQALSLGAKGYMDVAANVSTYLMAAQSVNQGALWVPPAILEQLSKFLTTHLLKNTQDEVTIYPKLSKRENEVMSLAKQGFSNKEIGSMLFISERTVKQHLTATFAKLGIKDRLQLILQT